MEQLDLIPEVRMCPHGMPETGVCPECFDEMMEDNDSTSRATATEHRFDGSTYEPSEDKTRLNTQLRKVFDFMRAGGRHTLGEIAESVGGSEAGVSARLRDFRKARFGGHVVERIRVEGGLFEYRLVANGELR